VRTAQLVQTICECWVKEDAEQRFVLAFGPGGVWSSLFSSAPGFRGTALLRDESNPRRYLVIDLWESAIQREQHLDEHSGAYAELDATLAKLVERKTEFGVFRAQADATVRARPRAMRHPRHRENR
jgi:heme-degrading monooxygenase HmoA